MDSSVHGGWRLVSAVSPASVSEALLEHLDPLAAAAVEHLDANERVDVQFEQFVTRLYQAISSRISEEMGGQHVEIRGATIPIQSASIPEKFGASSDMADVLAQQLLDENLLNDVPLADIDAVFTELGVAARQAREALRTAIVSIERLSGNSGTAAEESP